MRRYLVGVTVTVLTLGLLTVLAISCKDGGCPEGEREFAGECIPAESDPNIPDSDGDDIVAPPRPDGDVSVDGDTPSDGDSEEVPDVLTGSGTCSDPFLHSEGRASSMQNEDDLPETGSAVSGLPCVFADGDIEYDGGEPTAGSGLGPEVVIRVVMKAGDTLFGSFTGTGFDALVYLLDACDDTATCIDGAIDNAAADEAESVFFEAEKDQDIYLVLDSKNADDTGTFNYNITLQTMPDGDSDGDDPDGDDPDGDSDGDIDSDGDSNGTVPTYNITPSDTISVPAASPVTMTFTDIGWRTTSNPQKLYLVADDGLVIWDFLAGVTFSGDPLGAGLSDEYRGVTFSDSGDPVYLDQTNRIVEDPVTSSVISLPGTLGSQLSGIAFLDGDYWIAEAGTKQLAHYTYADDSWTFETELFSDFIELAGVVVIEGDVYLLDRAETASKSTLVKIDKTNFAPKARYVIQGVVLDGVAYQSSQQRLWGLKGASRELVRFNTLPD